MVTREELYELVWSTPMIRVAEKFEVSGSYLARVCTELRVPRPERGYWAKLAVGKAPQGEQMRVHCPSVYLGWSSTVHVHPCWFAIALCDPSLRALRDDRAEGVSVLSPV